MNSKAAKSFLILCVVCFLIFAVWFALRNISFFDITELEILCSGPVSGVSADVNRTINRLKGMNIFSIGKRNLVNKLLQFGIVDSVSVKRFFPGKLIVNVNYHPYQTKILVDNGVKQYMFLADKDKIIEVKPEVYELFSNLLSVYVDEDYAFELTKWGTDNGFAQMCILIESIVQSNLITNIKYDNTNSDDFGTMIIDFGLLNIRLFVHEPVMPDRLNDVIRFVVRDADGADRTCAGCYDLYANMLVRRR